MFYHYSCYGNIYFIILFSLQGYGMMTSEAVYLKPNGQVKNSGPLDYKIPGVRNIPRKFNVTLLKDCKGTKSLYSAKVDNLCTCIDLRFWYWILEYSINILSLIFTLPCCIPFLTFIIPIFKKKITLVIWNDHWKEKHEYSCWH